MGSVSKTKRPSIIESVTVNIVWHECLSTLITTADPVTGIKEGSWGREDQAACSTRVQAAWMQRSSHLRSEGSVPAPTQKTGNRLGGRVLSFIFSSEAVACAQREQPLVLRGGRLFSSASAPLSN